MFGNYDYSEHDNHNGQDDFGDWVLGGIIDMLFTVSYLPVVVFSFIHVGRDIISLWRIITAFLIGLVYTAFAFAINFTLTGYFDPLIWPVFIATFVMAFWQRHYTMKQYKLGNLQLPYSFGVPIIMRYGYSYKTSMRINAFLPFIAALLLMSFAPITAAWFFWGGLISAGRMSILAAAARKRQRDQETRELEIIMLKREREENLGYLIHQEEMQAKSSSGPARGIQQQATQVAQPLPRQAAKQLPSARPKQDYGDLLDD